MNNNRYIAAFTIFEVAVTMVITAVILMVVYQIFGVAQQQITTYIRMQDDMIEYEQFTTQFSVDVQRAREITALDNNSLELLIDQNEITYAFAKAYTLRKNTTVDTLFFKAQSMAIDTVMTPGKEHMVIHIQGDLLGTSIEVYETKRLDLSARINQLFD